VNAKVRIESYHEGQIEWVEVIEAATMRAAKASATKYLKYHTFAGRWDKEEVTPHYQIWTVLG